MANKIDPRDVFLKGKKIVLKVLTKQDVLNSNWYGWFNDDELCKTIQKHYFPNAVEVQMKFWEDLQNSTNKIQLGICKVDDNNVIGIVSLNHIDFINRKAEMSIIIGDKNAHNITIFTETCMVLFNHAFNSLNLNKIYGGSISKNLVQLMCRMLGCKEEGVARQEIFKEGKYHDAYLYSLLKEEFKFKI